MFYIIILENRRNGLIHNFIEIFLLDGTKTAINVTFNITSNNLTFYQARFRKRVTNQNFI